MTKAEMQAEIDRLDAECDKLAMILKRLLPDRHPGVYFICGEGGDRDRNGLPDRIHVCPAYGADFSVIYERVMEPMRS